MITTAEAFRTARRHGLRQSSNLRRRGDERADVGGGDEQAPVRTASMIRRAQVVGIGMVGASVAAGLRQRGWHVTGHDIDSDRVDEAERRGVVDAVGIDPAAELSFVATPVSAVTGCVRTLMSEQLDATITDVASVKAPIVRALADARFVGGHPMAGSERSGLDGTDPNLFDGATWVLTPSVTTDPERYLQVRDVVNQMGADVITLDAFEHDQIVATVSHVPHLAASALMAGAIDHADRQAALLRLAANGFRDMTRIAAGHPGLWADIAIENADAIVESLGRLVTQLDSVRRLVANGEREGLERFLGAAATARRELPLRQGRPAELHLLRIPISDRPGALGAAFAVFADVKANVEDVEIEHDTKGDRGTLVVTVAAEVIGAVQKALAERGLASSAEAL